MSLLLGAMASYYSYHTEEDSYRPQLARTGTSLVRTPALSCPDPILATDFGRLRQFVTLTS